MNLQKFLAFYVSSVAIPHHRLDRRGFDPGEHPPRTGCSCSLSRWCCRSSRGTRRRARTRPMSRGFLNSLKPLVPATTTVFRFLLLGQSADGLVSPRLFFVSSRRVWEEEKLVIRPLALRKYDGESGDVRRKRWTWC